MSLNSNSKRPTVAFSLPFALKERLDKLPSGEKSRLAEAAITQYLDQKSARLEVDEQLQTAAKSLYEGRDDYVAELTQIHGKIQAVYDHIVFQTGIIEALFGLKKNPTVPVVITNATYDQILRDAMATYAADPSLLYPQLQPEHDELERAARGTLYDNRVREISALIDSMPFMTDARFYRGRGMLGIAVFDREFKQPSIIEGKYEDKDFEIFNVDNSYHVPMVIFPESKPHFKINSRDNRRTTSAEGSDEIASILPVIMADYLAYRRFEKANASQQLQGKSEA